MRVVVIGAGISGLSCAFRLAGRGAEVTVLEHASRVGGVIASVARNGFLFELGPQSFQPTPALSDLIDAAGLEADLLAAPARAPRYVLAGGRLLAAPMGPDLLLRGGLLSLGTRVRLIRDLIGRSRPPDREESLGDFVRRKFGAQMLDRLAGPFVSGIYAGDPERLGLRDTFPDLHRWESEQGSILRGAMRAMRAMRSSSDDRGKRAPLATLRCGYGSLLEALAQKLGERVVLDAAVGSVAVAPASALPGFEIRAVLPSGPRAFTADAVVLATPADAAGRILSSVSPTLADSLVAVEYAPVAVVGVGYRREQVAHPLEGFGFLVARGEGRRLLGAVWQSSLFPARAPAGHVNLACFIGGATDPGVVDLEPDSIGAIVERELGQILAISGAPVERIVTVYRRALPQYHIGHRRRVAEMRATIARIPNLFLAGNYLEGPSTGACVNLSFRIADQLVPGRTESAAR